jgi:hypothetical protein
MVAMGWLPYPEAAKEEFLLQFPGPPQRSWTSDFAMKAESIRRPLEDFETKLKTLPPKTKAIAMAPKLVEFSYARDPVRVYLALNPCMLRAQAVREGAQWRIKAQTETDVRLARHARIRLINLWGQKFYFEEGLFWALQEKKWFFPYAITWTWEFLSQG